jgi:hypothetical protein
MDDKTKAIVLLKYKPMIEEFRKALIEERKNGASDARIAAMLDYIETNNGPLVDPEVLELLMGELRSAAWATHKGPGTMQ